MNYMTVKEAGEKWGLGIRIVTLHCVKGRIDGAVKKGNLWLIPENAAKPEDRRRKKAPVQAKEEAAVSKENAGSVQPLYENKELFARIIKHFPYPMHICAPDGTMLFANEAFFRFVKVSDPKENLRNHNVLNDPNLERWSVKDFVLRAYQGELVHAYDVKVPLQELVATFGGNTEWFQESLFHNMTAFPIYENNQLTYIVTVFTTSRYYQGREEVIKGKEYIDEHWKEEFDADKMAEIVHVSKYHYARLFKQHTGMTPHNYYQSVKLGKFKEMLCDGNLSITQVFDECGVDYNGNLAKKLKQKLGMTPSQYRTMMTQK